MTTLNLFSLFLAIYQPIAFLHVCDVTRVIFYYSGKKYFLCIFLDFLLVKASKVRNCKFSRISSGLLEVKMKAVCVLCFLIRWAFRAFMVMTTCIIAQGNADVALTV